MQGGEMPVVIIETGVGGVSPSSFIEPMVCPTAYRDWGWRRERPYSRHQPDGAHDQDDDVVGPPWWKFDIIDDED